MTQPKRKTAVPQLHTCRSGGYGRLVGAHYVRSPEPRPGRSPQNRRGGPGRPDRGRTRPPADARRARIAQADERRTAQAAPADPDRHQGTGTGQERPASDPRQDRRHRPGPRRPTSPPTTGTTRPANGAAAPRVQRRSVARRTLQRLPDRPERVPRDPAPPTPPRRPDRLHHNRNHHHLGPARQPPSRPRPHPARRGTHRPRRIATRRPPPTDLPAHRRISFNHTQRPTRGGLSLVCPL